MNNRKDEAKRKRPVTKVLKGWLQKFKLSPRQRAAWFCVLGVFVTVVVFGSVYSIGYNNGYSEAPVQNTSFNLDTLEAPFDRISTGTVKTVSDKKITIDVNGRDKSYQITDKTVVTERNDKRQVSDITSGAKVTVIRTSDKNTSVASKILIRSN